MVATSYALFLFLKLLRNAGFSTMSELCEALHAQHPQFPKATFTGSIRDSRGRERPQCIAHRGNAGKEYPENTLRAFEAALSLGAHALEIDVHATEDGVVVLSHDATLKRCYGYDRQIKDCRWSEIKHLETMETPRTTLPRLADLLRLLTIPGRESAWIYVDIRWTNIPEHIMESIAMEITRIDAGNNQRWEDRLVLGLWSANYLSVAKQYLPGFSVLHIGFSIPYSRPFQSEPHIDMSMHLPVLFTLDGWWFRKYVVGQRSLLIWTVNSVPGMEWCIEHKVAGVLTDHPALFLDVCEHYDDKHTKTTLRFQWDMFKNGMLIWVKQQLCRWSYFHYLAPGWALLREMETEYLKTA